MNSPQVLALALLATLALPAAFEVEAQTDARSAVAERVMTLTRDAVWRPAGRVPLHFPTHHPQGLVKVGNTLFLSSVEVRVPTRRGPQPGGYDRDTGAGVGWLFKLDLEGNLIGSVQLGDGAIYHPGGIDYDGTSLWVPVAEYRPNSKAIVYRVDPSTLKATEVLRLDDHLGGVAVDVEARTLHAVSWGSRRFYRFPLDARGLVSRPLPPLESLRTLNPSHYVDYQDCKYAGAHRMLCTGVTELRRPDGTSLRLGGVDLVDLRDGRPLHQLPVPLWTEKGLSMTQNPAWFEATDSGLRAYFIPEDEASTMYVFDVAVR